MTVATPPGVSRCETHRRWSQHQIAAHWRTAVMWCNAWFPPFRCAVVPCRCTVALLPFRSYRCCCGWERKCWKRLSAYTYIGMRWPERLWQNGKNRVRSYCYGTAVTAQRQVETATAQRIFSRKQRKFVILTALTSFLRNLRNGNAETATAERQLNGMVETRHMSAAHWRTAV